MSVLGQKRVDEVLTCRRREVHVCRGGQAIYMGQDFREQKVDR